MQLFDILEEIQEKTEHSLGDPAIVRKVNVIQAKIFRNYLKTVTLSYLDIVSGLTEYPLPVPMGQLLKVLIDGKEYKYGRITENSRIQFYFLLDKTLGLYPTPDKDVTRGITMFHYKTPETLSINDMEAEPDLDNNYHMLLVYGVAEDITKDAYFAQKYNELLNEMIMANQEPEPSQIQEVPW